MSVAVASCGGAFEPDAGLIEILADAGCGDPVEKELAHGDLGGSVAGGGRLFDQGDGRFAIVSGRQTQQAEVVLGGRESLFGGLGVGFLGFLERLRGAHTRLVEPCDREEGFGASRVGRA